MKPRSIAGVSRRRILAALGLAVCAAAAIEGGERLLRRAGGRRGGPAAAGPAPFRVLCVGDSITQHPIDDAYPRQLERLLARRPASRAISVRTAADGGWTSELIAETIGALLEREKPDLLVVMTGEPPPPDARRFRVPGQPIRWQPLTAGIVAPYGPPGPGRRAPPAPKPRPDGRSVVGLINAALGRGHSAAGPELREVVRLHPGDARPRFALAFWLAQHGLADEAQSVARQAAAMPQDALSYEFQADYYRAIGRWSQAIAARERAFALVLSANAAGRLAEEYLLVGEGERAIQLLEQCRRVFPRNDKIAGLLATAYLKDGRPEAAAQMYETASRLRRENPPPELRRDLRRIAQAARERGVALVLAQYPGRELDTLTALAGEDAGASFLGTQSLFREAVVRLGYDALFYDMDGGDFGHMTRLGHRMLAERLAEAVERFAPAGGTAPEPAEAERLASAGAWAPVETRFRRLLRADSADLAARYALARLFEESDRFREAEAQYDRILEAEPGHPGALLALARVAEAAGRSRVAEAAYRRLLERRPAHAPTLKALAELLLKQDRWGEADALLERLRAVAATRGDFLTAHRALAGIRERQGRLEQAEQLYRAVLGEEASPQARLDLARVCERRLRWDQAAEQYGAILAEIPDHATARVGMARVYERRGLLPEAEREYLALLRVSPENVEANRSLAGLYESTGRGELAEQRLAALLRALPGDATALRSLAEVSERRGDWASAEARYGRLLEQRPDDAQAVLGKAYALHRQGRTSQAEAELRRARGAAPGRFAPESLKRHEEKLGLLRRALSGEGGEGGQDHAVQ